MIVARFANGPLRGTIRALERLEWRIDVAVGFPPVSIHDEHDPIDLMQPRRVTYSLRKVNGLPWQDSDGAYVYQDLGSPTSAG